MPKKILLIENDSAFASGVARSLEERGLDVRVAADGRVGLELAREWAPAVVVLCVELPGMSGYLVCQKLRKDDALRAIPLVLTSAEATEETFEKHRTLKARADEYLLKPYAPEALLAILDALVGLPAPEEDEEIVTLEEEAGAEPEPPAAAELSALELEALPDEPAASVDEDLALLDHAFDEIAMPAPEQAGDALDRALAEAGLGDEPAELEEHVLELEAEPPPAAPLAAAERGSEAAAEAAGVLEARAVAAEADLAAVLDEAGHAAERARAAEEEATALRERLAEAESRAEEAQAEARRARAEAAAAAARAPELERQLEALGAELQAARAEASGTRGEAERRTGELRRRVAELEAAGAKNEERILKAYQRLKADERVKEKARKALAIAAQLLEEGAPVEAAPERDRRAAATPVAARD
jgi:DNA-binding response OmpR family regulator